MKQKESNTQRFERNLLKQSKKASHVLLTPLPFQFYFPPQFFLFSFSTILLFSLLHHFFIISPSSMFFIPLLHLHLLIYSIYFSIHKNIDLLATLHQPHIDPTSSPHRPYIDHSSTPHRPYTQLFFLFNTAS